MLGAQGSRCGGEKAPVKRAAPRRGKNEYPAGEKFDSRNPQKDAPDGSSGDLQRTRILELSKKDFEQRRLSLFRARGCPYRKKSFLGNRRTTLTHMINAMGQTMVACPMPHPGRITHRDPSED
jgi:hypothetical protein